MTATALPIRILFRPELDALLRACSRRSPSGLRDRALTSLLYGSWMAPACSWPPAGATRGSVMQAPRPLLWSCIQFEGPSR